MSDIDIRVTGQAGRITLTRPGALNALTYEMVMAIEAALDDWATTDAVKLVVIDAEGEKAFSAGGDITEMYRTASTGDFAYGRKFWQDEYRTNAKIANYPKPYIAFMQGFTMGGGVGVSCHGSHRVVGTTSRIAMPECGIGLVPDVGGMLLLARAPGHLGEYLGTTGTRMRAGDAIHAGFADVFVPETDWPALIARLEQTGDAQAIAEAAQPAPPAPLAEQQPLIDAHFGHPNAADILQALPDDDWGRDTEKALRQSCPLSVACTIELVRRVRSLGTIEDALQQEYRFTHRSASDGDFVEGIRAAVIDKDRNPRWRHARTEDVTPDEVAQMLAPLGQDELYLGGTT